MNFDFVVCSPIETASRLVPGSGVWSMTGCGRIGVLVNKTYERSWSVLERMSGPGMVLAQG
jgi:hypothetical protein